MKRDIGQAQAYRAEQKSIQRRRLPLLTKAEVVELVDAVMAKPRSYADRITWKVGGGSLAWAGLQLLQFGTSPAGLTHSWLVLHECAHLLAPVGAGHSEPWRVIYVDLVRKWIGDEAADELRKAFDTEPLRRKSNRPRKAWKIVARRDISTRFLFEVEGHGVFGNVTADYQRAKAMLLPGEIVRTDVKDGRARYFALLRVERDATAAELACLDNSARASMRRGALFLLEGGKVELLARSIKPAVAAGQS